MKRVDGQDESRAVTFSQGGACSHCGEDAVTAPLCTDGGEPVDVCRACVIAAFEMASNDDGVSSEN